MTANRTTGLPRLIQVAQRGVRLASDSVRSGRLAPYVWRSGLIPGWTRGDEAVALSRASYELPEGAVIVEIGSWLGSSSVLLAGARKLRRSGVVHAVDPFDGSGDAYSTPVYGAVKNKLSRSLRQVYDHNILRAGLSNFVEVHEGTAADVALTWTGDVDLLFLDGDQSYEGVRSAFNGWSQFLKPGATIAVHNSQPGSYAETHDGHVRLVEEEVCPPEYTDVRLIGTTTFARKR